MSTRFTAEKRTDMRGIFIFALLAAFAMLSLIVVIIGARSYRGINVTAEQAFLSRTGMSYLVGKVRGADAAGQIEIRKEGDLSVLALGQELEGKRYLTYIYCDGTQVREYFSRADVAFSADYGGKIFEASGLTFSLDQGLLQISIVDAGGNTHEGAVYLHAATEGGA